MKALTTYQTREITVALVENFGFRWPRAERWMQGGRCPCCNKRRLFVFAAFPEKVRCNRANRCGFEISTRDLFPYIFESELGFHGRRLANGGAYS